MPFILIYYMDKSYATGFINSYIYAQKIPSKDIKYKKVYLNWTDMGHWTAKVRVHENGKYYNYFYVMPNKKFIILSATNSSNTLSVNVNKLKYGKIN